jgi:hypothetical protein
MKRAFLPPSLMITSIIGFIISAIYTVSGAFDSVFASWGEYVGTSLGFSFCLAFVIMFIASMVSMTPTEHELRP